MTKTNLILHGDSLTLLREKIANDSINLIYIDPPFNTGKTRQQTRIQVAQDKKGDRIGFQGQRYKTLRAEKGAGSYSDSFDDYLAFLKPRLVEARRVLKSSGSFFLHLDWRESHYCKILCDEIFGRESFMNEIVWAYDFGGRSKRKWSAKHDVIFWYAKDPRDYVFNYDEVDRIPYMAPGLVGREKAALGKTLTDVWWHTIVPTNSREKTGYPNQKPLGILERIVRVHSRRGDVCLDFFAGSGSFGAAAARHGRRFILIDINVEAVSVMRSRLGGEPPRASFS